MLEVVLIDANLKEMFATPGEARLASRAQASSSPAELHARGPVQNNPPHAHTHPPGPVQNNLPHAHTRPPYPVQNNPLHSLPDPQQQEGALCNQVKSCSFTGILGFYNAF